MDFQQWRGSRRAVLRQATTVAAGGALAATFAQAALSQAFAQATPVAMPYPELTVTITDKALQPSSTQVPTGFVLLTVVNQSKDSNSAALLGPAPGQTMAQLQQAAATPAATPNGFPPFLYTATVLGGPGEIAPGGTGQAIIQVPAGEWIIFSEGNQSGVPITASAGTPTSQVPPAATVTITEVDFAFGGFGVPIKPGKQTWAVRNVGSQPHMLVLGQVPPGTTVDQVLAAVSQPRNATPTPGALTEKDFHEVSPAGVLLQSKGTTVWPLLDLPTGHYAALCFVTDPSTGKLHAMEGMVAVFDVGSAATPAATPSS